MKFRKIISLTALISFVFLILTSIVLYIVPQGRVAYWSDWRLLGLTKTDWGNIHINLGLLLLLSIAFHIYYNWKPIVAYLKNKARQLTVFTPDFNVAAIVVIAFIVGTYFLMLPFLLLLAFNAEYRERFHTTLRLPVAARVEPPALATSRPAPPASAPRGS